MPDPVVPLMGVLMISVAAAQVADVKGIDAGWKRHWVSSNSDTSNSAVTSNMTDLVDALSPAMIPPLSVAPVQQALFSPVQVNLLWHVSRRLSRSLSVLR